MSLDQPNTRGTALRDEVRAAVAARQELGEPLEGEVIAAFLARIESTVAESSATHEAELSARGRFTARIAWSLALGIPLVAVAGGVGGAVAESPGGVIGVVAALLTVIGLNAYYTEVEKEMELKRLDLTYRRR